MCALLPERTFSQTGLETAMRVVVTRPRQSARRTADILRAMGHEPVELPLTEAVHDLEAAVEALALPHGSIAVTSAQAIRVLAYLPPEALRAHLATPLYAVGEATANAARHSGFSHIVVAGGNGGELAMLVSGSQAKTHFPLLYLAGKPRSPDFEERLKAQGVAHRVVQCYEIHPIAAQDIPTRMVMAQPMDAVLLYSRETTILFFRLFSPYENRLRQTRFLCFSPNVASAVPGTFAPQVEIAADPSQAALLALL